MCCFATYGHVGYQLVAMITDKETHLTTCLEMSLCMSKSVNWPYSPKIYKYVACVWVGGSPPVDLVISGTDWCWFTNTDNELHLSFYLWS